ncbi:hypothetical protein [Bacillus sp. SG-1]|uniref:hypothetical protein n=1 Tax=Bacillus sp. SG-1 TaxID=161544 RepID=UPI0005C5C0CF|nr:hypothetical protein [Bacillus sp. SG-1]
MKKIFAIMWSTVMLLAFSLPFTAASAEDPIIQSIDEKLESVDFYYQQGSAKVMDFTDLYMEIAINEEEVEKQKVKMVFVKYQTDRDTIFHFNKQEVFYYSLDKNTLLENDSVIGNAESKAFITDHQDDYRKQITPGSLALILIFIFTTVLLFPLAVLLLQKNTPSDKLYPYEL